jgi:hypothetical protein
MGALLNHDHERFCQELRKRILAGEKRASARVGAYRATMYTGKAIDDTALSPNARRLANRKDVAARLGELDDFAAKLAGIDSGWALLKLKKLADAIENFNLDDYLGPVNDKGRRYFDLSRVPPEKLAILSELAIDDTTIVKPSLEEGEPDEIHHSRKMKLKGPAKADMVGPIALMARIAGWEAPKKIAPTDKDGKDLSLGDLVAASMAKVLERRQGAAKPPEHAPAEA